MCSWRLALAAAVLALLAGLAGQAPGQPAPRPATPTGPTLRLGALLPLTGPGAWFGAEIKQGLEMAAAELDPAPRRTASPASGGTQASSAPAADERGTRTGSESGTAESAKPGDGTEAVGVAGSPKAPRPPPEPVEPPDRPRTLTLVVQAVDVQPADRRSVEDEATRLLGSGASVIVTASPAPTLTVHPLAAARDVLVLHAGLANDRFPAASRILFQMRPLVASRADTLAAHAWHVGIRRLGLVAGGDDFGRAVRAGVGARWRELGGHLAPEASVSLDASDLRARLRAVVRAAPEAVVLGFQGAALGEAARAVREAGYAGRLWAADDDRAALLAGGQALDGARILADAFVPLPDSRGARFARAYEARHGQPPSRFAASAYEAAVLLADAARVVIGRGASVTGSRLREVLLAGRRVPSLYAGELVVRDDGTIGRPLALFRTDAGRLTFETYVAVDGRPVGATRGESP